MITNLISPSDIILARNRFSVKILDFHTIGDTSGKGERDAQIACAARTPHIIVIVEQRNFAQLSVLVDSISGREFTSDSSSEIHDLGGVGFAEGFGENEDGIVDSSDGPLVKGRLICGWGY